MRICRECHQKTAEHQFVDRQWSRVPRCGLRWSSSQQHSHAVRAVRPTRTKSTYCRQSSIRLHSAHTGSMLPTTLLGKSPCEVAESVIRRPQNTSSWTGSGGECRDAVCVKFSQQRCGESHRAKLQRVSSEDCRTPVRGQAVKQSAEMRSALLPTMLWGKSPCEVAESVIRRPQNTSLWTGSEAECRDAVCVGVLRNSTVMP